MRRSDHPQSVQNGRAEDHRIDREFGPPHPKAAALPHRVALLPLLPIPSHNFRCTLLPTTPPTTPLPLTLLRWYSRLLCGLYHPHSKYSCTINSFIHLYFPPYYLHSPFTCAFLSRQNSRSKCSLAHLSTLIASSSDLIVAGFITAPLTLADHHHHSLQPPFQ